MLKSSPFHRTHVLQYLGKAVAVVDDLVLARYLIMLVREPGIEKRLSKDIADHGAELLLTLARIAATADYKCGVQAPQ